MEQKFKQFIEYDWKNSKEWLSYYNSNCYIAPPVTGDKILKARKKFYKLKVDPEFDINYTPSFTKHNHHHHAHCNHNNSNSSNSNISKSIIMQITCAIESFLWVAYFMNMLIPKYILDICFVVVLIRFIRENFFDLFTLSYYKSMRILFNELIHLMIYSFILRLDRINYLNLFPFTSTALYCICEYFVNYLRMFQFMKKYFQKVVDMKRKIYQCRGFAYILYGVYLIFAFLMRWSRIWIVVVYPGFMVFMYYFNSYVNEVVNKIWSMQDTKKDVK